MAKGKMAPPFGKAAKGTKDKSDKMVPKGNPFGSGTKGNTLGKSMKKAGKGAKGK